MCHGQHSKLGSSISIHFHRSVRRSLCQSLLRPSWAILIFLYLSATVLRGKISYNSQQLAAMYVQALASRDELPLTILS